MLVIKRWNSQAHTVSGPTVKIYQGSLQNKLQVCSSDNILSRRKTIKCSNMQCDTWFISSCWWLLLGFLYIVECTCYTHAHTHMQACMNVHTYIHPPRWKDFLSNGPVIHTSPMTVSTVEIIYTAEIMRSTQHTLFVILDFYHSFRKPLLSVIAYLSVLNWLG